MVSDGMAFFNDFFAYMRIFKNIFAYTKKSSFYIKIVKYIQNVFRKIRDWSIIEGKEQILAAVWDIPNQIFGNSFEEIGGFIKM